jgi:Domain of unknown function (DUF4338)
VHPGGEYLMSHRYCGRTFTAEEIQRIAELIRVSPETSRAMLSRRVCEMFHWHKPDGGIKEMSCRVAMLRMQEDGLITLPPRRAANFDGRRGAPTVTTATDPKPPITAPVDQLPPLEFLPVSAQTREGSRLWNEYIQRYHYLGYTHLSGAQLRYFVTVDGQFVALLGFGAAAWKTAPRDQFIGWSPQQRHHHRHLVVNNARFLILPWVRSKGLASKILGHIARRLPTDWQQRYGYRPVLLETFVQTDRFRGTCYKAANWIHVGQTTGRGKLDVTHQYSLPVKDVWLYPLVRSFRQHLIA